eukprot:c1996_g1_i1.p1 GENE.c1996_g1_i1~~c1996_g1_i1.p1  ORF type:complete len:449 (-),score=73.67 c1996_g1_i1:109-1359(-)
MWFPPFIIPVPIPYPSTRSRVSNFLCFGIVLMCTLLLIIRSVPRTTTIDQDLAAETQNKQHDDHALPEACQKTPLFVDRHRRQTIRQRSKTTPRLSIIYITKRPGGYDVLLNSLAQQNHDDPLSFVYELICVDELAPYRAARVYAMADELDVNLVAIVPSKPKAPQHKDLRFGIYNAINTGILLARGSIVTFVMDLAWIPPNFVSRTLKFYSNPTHAKSLLAYPENFFFLHTEAMPAQHAFLDKQSISFFSKNQTSSFSSQPDRFVSGQMRPEQLIRDKKAGIFRGFEKQPLFGGNDMFWELSFASCPWSVLETLNGVEEVFDYGDDCHEVNIRLRSEFLGYDLWVDGQVVVENLWHKGQFEPKGSLWNRFKEDNIMYDVIVLEPGQIRDGIRPLQSQGHMFNLTLWRKNDCPSLL